MLEKVAEGALGATADRRSTPEVVPGAAGEAVGAGAAGEAVGVPGAAGEAVGAGAADEIVVEQFRLYDLDFKGCVSCFACKRVGARLERCALLDGLTPLLDAVADCDGLVIGSPIYLSEVTGLTRAFLERLCFPYLSYDKKPSSFPKRIKTGFVYTANAPEDAYGEIGYWDLFRRNGELLERLFGKSSWVLASETWQFDDYEKYASGMFDAAQRAERHATVFPQDLQRAFELGAWLLA
jgi:multimeric flavodoxin WrbA